jgi:hypothetical protein
MSNIDFCRDILKPIYEISIMVLFDARLKIKIKTIP